MTDINLRYVTLGPADVDIGFAGGHAASDPLHERIARFSPGDQVTVSGRHVKEANGHAIGRLAAKTALNISASAPGSVSGILVRSREQTPPEYSANLKVDRWETLLVELAIPSS